MIYKPCGVRSSATIKTRDVILDFNMFSEKVTDIAKENGILAIGAIKLKNNNIMKKVNNRYFMVFDWLECKTLKAE